VARITLDGRPVDGREVLLTGIGDHEVVVTLIGG